MNKKIYKAIQLRLLHVPSLDKQINFKGKEELITKIIKMFGMKVFQNIVLNLCRGVVEVKNNISSQGVGEIVRQHKAHWRQNQKLIGDLKHLHIMEHIQQNQVKKGCQKGKSLRDNYRVLRL